MHQRTGGYSVLPIKQNANTCFWEVILFPELREKGK